MFDPETITPAKLETFRHAAESSWGDDTRHEKFAGHPEINHGQCYVTSKWLTKHWGGYIGVKKGHFFWVAPDKSQVVDLTGDGDHTGAVRHERATHPDFKDMRVKVDTPDTPRAKLFAQRADGVLAGHKIADLVGDAYPAESPQVVEDMNQKYLHDEPWSSDAPPKQYQFFYGNGQLHVSPIHTHDQLRQASGVPTDHAGPIATGNVVVSNGRAKWTAHSNIALKGLVRIMRDYGNSVGWKWDGLAGSESDPVLAQFGPARKTWFASRKGNLVLSESPLVRYAGRIDIEGTHARIALGRTEEVGSLVDGLEEWAKDFGYRLAEYPGTSTDMGDKMKTRERLETFDRWDPNWNPEPKNDGDPETNFDCPTCGLPLDSFGDYMLHVQDHHPITEDPIQNGHFPQPGELDDPLPAHRHDSRPVAMPLSSFQEVAHVEGFDLYSELWGFRRDKGLIFYGGYDRGELLGYAFVRPDGDETELGMVNAVPGRGLGLALVGKILQYHSGVYSHAASAEGERLMKRLGFVNVKGQKYRYAANEPKDMIEADLPFIFDVQQDIITIGHPGTRTADITHPAHGQFTPGGIVEGYYAPGGKMTIQTMTDMPWSVRHMVQLFYWSHPQMEVTGVELKDSQGNTTKLATSQSVGTYLKNLAATDPAAWRAYQALKNAGGQVHVVGGAVRDALLQREPKDIDLMVSGLPPEEVEHALSQASGSVNLTGKKFGVYRYKTHGSEVEIALPRQDKYESGRRGEGQITVDHTLPIEKDLERRDFTANSMAVNLDNGQLIDPFGGAKDIERGVLRTTHPSSFEEDPTRLVRALVASSRHGLAPDERTRQEMIANASKLSGESPDTINKELDKLFRSSNPAGAIRLAQDTGVLHHLFPELAHNFDYDQNNSHHNFSLGDHTLNVLDHISKKSPDGDLRLAALLHDVGKPNSAWTDPQTGYNHYYEGPNGLGADHEIVGAKMAEDRLRALHYPTARIRRIQALVTHHMFPGFSSPKGARKFLQNVGDHADDLLTLREADMSNKGTNDPRDGSVDKMRGLVEQARSQQDPTQQSALSINGDDILGLGVPAGPQVGAILRNLTDQVVSDPTLNDKQTLLNLATEYHAATPT